MISLSLGWIGLNLAITLAVFVSMVGSINYSSKKSIKLIRQRPAVLHRMGKDRERKCLQRELRAIRDLRIRMGSAFFYDRTLVFTTFETILQSTVNLLLLY